MPHKYIFDSIRLRICVRLNVTLCDLDWLECSCRLSIEEPWDLFSTKTEIINCKAVRFIERVAAEGCRKHNNNLFGLQRSTFFPAAPLHGENQEKYIFLNQKC